MPDNQQNKATPWTPGPWIAYFRNVWTGTDPETHGAPIARPYIPSGLSGGGGWGPSVVMDEADAALIALAPEMAAAILAWLDALEWTNGPIPEGDALRMAIEGTTPARGELLRLGVALRALSRENTTEETR